MHPTKMKYSLELNRILGDISRKIGLLSTHKAYFLVLSLQIYLSVYLLLLLLLSWLLGTHFLGTDSVCVT
jgi:hypothetical protein